MSAKPSWLSLMLKLASIAATEATIIAASIFFFAALNMAAARTGDEFAAIRARIQEYQSAWNTHEPAAVAAFFANDADFVMGNLPAAHGKQAIQYWWRDYFVKQEPERIVTIVMNSVRLIAADIALTNISTTTGDQDTNGGQLLIRKARGTWVLHRQRGNWLISAMRGFPTEEDDVVLTASLEAVEALRPDIRAFVDKYEDAFNNHDPSAVSAFYRNDADIIVRNGPLIHGSQAIADWWRAYFSKPRPYRALLIIDNIRMIDADVAIINIIATGALQEGKDEQPPLRYARATWVVTRVAGEWKIAALWVLPGEEDRIIRRSSH